jgi:hypothetical protein
MTEHTSLPADVRCRSAASLYPAEIGGTFNQSRPLFGQDENPPA